MFLFFSCCLMGLSLILQTETVSVDSARALIDTKIGPISVAKVTKQRPAGTSNGFNTSFYSFMIRTLSLETGEEVWHKTVGLRDDLIGDTSEGLLVVNGKVNKLSLLDAETGKKRMTESELFERVPGLKGNLSYELGDYAIDTLEDIYFYGLDGACYNAKLVTNELSQDVKYKEKILQNKLDVFYKSGYMQQDSEFLSLYPELMDLKLLESDHQVQWVTFHQRRNDQRQTVALLSTLKHE